MITVHILEHGRTRCEELPGTPSRWPEGHLWVAFDSPVVKKLATCEHCITKRTVQTGSLNGQFVCANCKNTGVVEHVNYGVVGGGLIPRIISAPCPRCTG